MKPDPLPRSLPAGTRNTHGIEARSVVNLEPHGNQMAYWGYWSLGFGPVYADNIDWDYTPPIHTVAGELQIIRDALTRIEGLSK